jgi:hypothetical protein
MTVTIRTALLIVALTLFAGCAGTRKASVHPLVGTWDYAVDANGQEYPGSLILSGTAAVESGIISSQAGEVALENLEVEGSSFTCEFDGGQMGIIQVAGEIDGDAVSGKMTLEAMGDFPFTGTRRAPEAE